MTGGIYAQRVSKALTFGRKVLNANDATGGKFKLSIIFKVLLVTHVSFCMALAIYVAESFNEMAIGRRTELGAMLLVVSRSLFFVIMLILKCSLWDSLLGQMIEDRKNEQESDERDSDDVRKLKETCYKNEFLCASTFISISSLGSFIIIVSCWFKRSNEYRLPFSFHIPALPVDGTSFNFNWAINYAFQAFSVLAVSSFKYIYYPICLIIINHTCLIFDESILMVNNLNLSLRGKSPKISIEKRLQEIVESTYHARVWQKKAQSMLQFNFLCEFSALSFLICMCLFTISSDGTLNIVSVLGGALMQLFLYCWMGTRLIKRIQFLVVAIYDTEWHLMTVRQRKQLLIILLMAQNMKGLNGIFSSLDLETYLKVMQFSYSLFTFLQSSN